MKSSEIQLMRPTDLTSNGWLREIALQLSLLNEKKGPGRPPKHG
jgi:hypothetical protein